ncbi:MAG: hypothetical protein ACYSTX_01905 [Planctomycetota bacterium]|jgi:hypothetical protein
MAFRNIFTKTGKWLQRMGQGKEERARAAIPYNEDSPEATIVTDITRKTEHDESLARMEKLEEGFDNMINQLEDINGHLQSLPEFVKNQRMLTNQLIDYIRTSSDTEQRLIDTMQRLPQETAKASKRVMWMFSLIVGLCLLVILSLAGIMIYFK